MPALNKNVRNEIKKGKKVYFYDCGIRNAVIDNFKSIDTRTDAGALWENYIIAERMKLLHYNKVDTRQYFWRTTQQQEIDLIEETNEQWAAFEFKRNPNTKVRFPQTFSANYANATMLVVTPANLEDFL